MDLARTFAPPAAADDVADLVPYLQVPKPDSMYICWKTATDTESTVRFGTSPNALTQTVQGTCADLTPKDSSYVGTYLYHSVQLTGLAPDTKYYYQVQSGTQISAVSHFRTLPEAGNAQGHFRFLVLGDHQIPDDRYERLMKSAKATIQKNLGVTDVEDAFRVIVNDGDQVDSGTLWQYENIHLGESRVLSPNLPIATAVGNHETYGVMGLSAYDDHYFYDQYSYQGITSGTKYYYAFQAGRALFIMMSSEHPGDEQLAWIQKVVDAARNDASVDWVFSVAHRPIQAESYTGDDSPWIRDSVIPVLCQTPKHVLYISGHHHLYARGQVRDLPCYHMISGAAAWDQYWGQGPEMDHDDVQKTLTDWTYQLVDLDPAGRSMTVDSYAIGGPRLGIVWEDAPRLVDHFTRTFGLEAPAKPTALVDNPAVTLPCAFRSSPYASPASVPMNSTEFQVAGNPEFTTPRIDLYRDFEDLYRDTGAPDYVPVDQNKGVDLMSMTVPANALPNGTWFLRVRHRDQNLEWSPWSDSASFQVSGSTVALPTLSTTKRSFAFGEDIPLAYANGPGLATDWIGIYQAGQTPGGPPSTAWAYVSGGAGQLTLRVPDGKPAGAYFAAYFTNDGYQEIADRIPLYVGSIPKLSSAQTSFPSGGDVTVAYKDAPALDKDAIGVFALGAVPGTDAPKATVPVTGATGTITFPGLANGYYFATYLLNGGNFEPSDRLAFQVGDHLGTIQTDKAAYGLGQPISVTFQNGPGTPKDWLGIYRKGVDPQSGYLERYVYVDGNRSGTATFDATNVPRTSGDYFVVLFTNDSYTEVSNRVAFSVAGAADATIHTVASLTASSVDQAASVPDQAGATYAWTVQGGVLTSAANGPSISFHAGSGDSVTLNVQVTGISGDQASASVTIPVLPITADLDGDGKADPLDLATFIKAYGGRLGDGIYMVGADLNADGTVDDADLKIILSELDK